ncbi:hypothetical protein IMCC3317_11130 [Kordia antarctica]|uniref:Lipoprotein n=1 Tax=Kordia antarctica TaxID=1218801 RepID=A0A7L4ZGK2_9FLAO|nr:hypothetical protein [Kordia antarctica]QHI35765.1 hypothetical protein IMCC3317_11130 [Kordia antarctica]
MKTKYALIFLCFILFACNPTYMPFESKKDKKKNVSLIKTKLNLTNKEYSIIKNEDSVLYSLSLSVGKDEKISRIERRLDSFIQKKYTQKELIAILKIDRNLPNRDLEFSRSKKSTTLNIKDMKELREFMNNGGKEKLMDSIFGIKFKDSIKKQKQ